MLALESCRVVTIQWIRHPRFAHAQMGVTRTAHGDWRKVAVLFSAGKNPKLPKGVDLGARPFTLELYLPMVVGIDRILKYQTEEAAKHAAQSMLRLFVAEVSVGE